MNPRLRIEFDEAEGALLRMLGLVERRGYQLGEVLRRGGIVEIELVPRDPSRRVEVIARQLENLVDVRSITILPQPREVAR